jgi:hypothetical protein
VRGAGSDVTVVIDERSMLMIPAGMEEIAFSVRSVLAAESGCLRAMCPDAEVRLSFRVILTVQVT